MINTPLPQVLAANLADCATASGSFSFSPQGMAFGEITQLEIEVTADELAGATRSQIITIGGVESDTPVVASRTYDFETDYSGWTVIDGTYNRESPGANGTSFHLHSTHFLDDQCDVARSPAIRLKANSTLSLGNRYDTENPVPIPYDRANVGIVDLDARACARPSCPTAAGCTTCPRARINGACVTNGRGGLVRHRADLRHQHLGPGGHEPGRHLHRPAGSRSRPPTGRTAVWPCEGFHFDEVTVTNFDEFVADAQPNVCGTGIDRAVHRPTSA